MDEKVQGRMFERFRNVIPVLERLIENSFLDNKMQSAYKQLIVKKFSQLNLLE